MSEDVTPMEIVGLTDVAIEPATPLAPGTWAVVDGDATVFLADRQPGDVLGRRTSVITLSAPAIVALPEAPEGRAWLLADTRATVVELSAADWSEVVWRGALALSAEALSSAIRGTVPPPGDRVNKIGPRPVFVSAGRSALVDALCWVRPVEGEPRIAGYPLPPDGAPVGPHLPMVDSGYSALVASSLDDVEMDRAVEGLRWLYGLAAACAVAAEDTRRAAELAWADRSSSTELEAEVGAVRLLSREIVNAGAPVLALGSDPLIAVASIVGQAAGFEIQAPRGGLRGREGTAAVRAIATSSGLFVRTVTLDPGWEREAVEPMIGFEPDGTPVALLLERNGAQLIEADGTEHKVGAPGAPELITKAFVFSQPPEGEDLSEGDLLRRAVRGQGRALWLTLVWSLIIAAVSLTVPLASGVVFGEIIPEGDTSRLVWLIVALVTAAVAVLPVQIAATAANTRLEAAISLNLQRGIWGRVLRSPVSLIKRLGPGDLTVRLAALEMGRDMVDQSVIAVIPVVLGALVSVFVLFFYEPVLAWFAIGWGLIVLLISVLMALRVAKAQRAVDVATGEVNGFLFQVLGAIPKLHVAGAESRAFAAWAQRFRGAVGQQLTIKSAQQILVSGLIATSSTLVLFLAVALTNTVHNVGTFIAFQTTYSLFLAGISAFTGALSVIIQLRPAMQRATELVNEVSESGAGRSDPGPLRGDVALRNLTFRYQADSPLVLDGLDLEVRAGEMVAIVGHSGCGKSTILRILLGFEQPEQGSVLFDNQELKSLDVESVRRQLGVVLQDGQLMPGSIFQNLSGAATISEAEAWELAEIVALADDIRAMPMKLETMITMNGGAFSGGQRQRLLIARALASKPRILLLDEATSALDNVTQKIVTQNLAEVGMTRIVVAHRLSTIVDADRIIVLDHGKVSEIGTYDELMARGGAFHALATRQVV